MIHYYRGLSEAKMAHLCYR